MIIYLLVDRLYGLRNVLSYSACLHVPGFSSSPVSIFTGSRTGIGAATAFALSEGDSTVAVQFNPSEATASQVVKQVLAPWGKSFALQADLAQAESVGRPVDAVLERSGLIDLLVNNAEWMIGPRNMLTVSDDYWHKLFEINVAPAAAVNPSIIDTPFHDRFTSAQQITAVWANIAQGRTGTAEETTSVIIFLTSNAASPIAGEAIEVNGGLWMD
jgi:NAD(P)-dependent dehydrogenase (short-subunit alcohol dehydrogenase family)